MMKMEEVYQTPSGIRVGDLVRVVRPRPGLSEAFYYTVKKVNKRIEYARTAYYLTLGECVGQFFEDRFQKIHHQFTPDKEYEELYD